MLPLHDQANWLDQQITAKLAAKISIADALIETSKNSFDYKRFVEELQESGFEKDKIKKLLDITRTMARAEAFREASNIVKKTRGQLIDKAGKRFDFGDDAPWKPATLPVELTTFLCAALMASDLSTVRRINEISRTKDESEQMTVEMTQGTMAVMPFENGRSLDSPMLLHLIAEGVDKVDAINSLSVSNDGFCEERTLLSEWTFNVHTSFKGKLRLIYRVKLLETNLGRLEVKKEQVILRLNGLRELVIAQRDEKAVEVLDETENDMHVLMENPSSSISLFNLPEQNGSVCGQKVANKLLMRLRRFFKSIGVVSIGDEPVAADVDKTRPYKTRIMHYVLARVSSELKSSENEESVKDALPYFVSSKKHGFVALTRKPTKKGDAAAEEARQAVEEGAFVKFSEWLKDKGSLIKRAAAFADRLSDVEMMTIVTTEGILPGSDRALLCGLVDLLMIKAVLSPDRFILVDTDDGIKSVMEAHMQRRNEERKKFAKKECSEVSMLTAR